MGWRVGARPGWRWRWITPVACSRPIPDWCYDVGPHTHTHTHNHITQSHTMYAVLEQQRQRKRFYVVATSVERGRTAAAADHFRQSPAITTVPIRLQWHGVQFASSAQSITTPHRWLCDVLVPRAWPEIRILWYVALKSAVSTVITKSHNCNTPIPIISELQLSLFTTLISVAVTFTWVLSVFLDYIYPTTRTWSDLIFLILAARMLVC